MPPNHSSNRAWALLIARLTLGFIFFMAGVWKVFSHLVTKPLYEFHTHVIPRTALLLFLLVMPAEEDRFSLDGWLRSRASTG
jgi:uncharacterized membrane protein YphA (DoxX/SURF4 family)